MHTAGSSAGMLLAFGVLTIVVIAIFVIAAVCFRNRGGPYVGGGVRPIPGSVNRIGGGGPIVVAGGGPGGAQLTGTNVTVRVRDLEKNKRKSKKSRSLGNGDEDDGGGSDNDDMRNKSARDDDDDDDNDGDDVVEDTNTNKDDMNDDDDAVGRRGRPRGWRNHLRGIRRKSSSSRRAFNEDSGSDKDIDDEREDDTDGAAKNDEEDDDVDVPRARMRGISSRRADDDDDDVNDDEDDRDERDNDKEKDGDDDDEDDNDDGDHDVGGVGKRRGIASGRRTRKSGDSDSEDNSRNDKEDKDDDDDDDERSDDTGIGSGSRRMRSPGGGVSSIKAKVNPKKRAIVPIPNSSLLAMNRRKKDSSASPGAPAGNALMIPPSITTVATSSGTSSSSQSSPFNASISSSQRTWYFIGLQYMSSGEDMRLAGCGNDVTVIAPSIMAQLAPADPANVTIITDSSQPRADRATILRTLESFLKQTNMTTAIFWYSGHGVSISAKDEAIVPLGFAVASLNSPPAVLASKLIVDNDLNKLFTAATVPTVLAVFDCCHSGSMLDLPHHWTVGVTPQDMTHTNGSPAYARDLATDANARLDTAKTEFKFITTTIGDAAASATDSKRVDGTNGKSKTGGLFGNLFKWRRNEKNSSAAASSTKSKAAAHDGKKDRKQKKEEEKQKKKKNKTNPSEEKEEIKAASTADITATSTSETAASSIEAPAPSLRAAGAHGTALLEDSSDDEDDEDNPTEEGNGSRSSSDNNHNIALYSLNADCAQRRQRDLASGRVVIFIGACRESETDADEVVGNTSFGALTHAFQQVCRKANYVLTWRQLLYGIQNEFKSRSLRQRPTLESSVLLDLDAPIQL